MHDLSPYQEISSHAMPYCAMHNRLFPHLGVGWLTPARVEGLDLVPARCPRCIKEDGDNIMLYVWGCAPLACN